MAVLIVKVLKVIYVNQNHAERIEFFAIFAIQNRLKSPDSFAEHAGERIVVRQIDQLSPLNLLGNVHAAANVAGEPVLRVERRHAAVVDPTP